MKRPSFQFYPNDWLSAPEVRAMSIAARGLWIDMICLMHQGDPYGYLTLAGKGILPPTLARITGIPLDEIEGLLSEIEATAAFSKTEDGIIFCRRMIRDEEIREKRASGGIKSLNHPNVARAKHTKQAEEGHPSRVSLDPSPSSSSSSSTTSSSTSLEDKSSTASLSAKPARKPDPLYEIFAENFQQSQDSPYLSKRADFIQLTALRKKCDGNKWELTTERFRAATGNYFASELGQFTLADLCVRFSTFFKTPLDRFGKPPSNGNSVSHHTSRAEILKQQNKAAGDEWLKESGFQPSNQEFIEGEVIHD